MEGREKEGEMEGEREEERKTTIGKESERKVGEREGGRDAGY